MIRKIKSIIAAMTWLNLFFVSSGYTTQCLHITYRIQGLPQALMSPVQQRLNHSLQTLKEPSTEDIQFWSNHGIRDIKKTLEIYGYFKPSIHRTVQKIGENWEVRYQISAGPPLKITTLELSIVNTPDDPQIKNLMNDFPLHQGERFCSKAYEDAKENLLAQVVADGYLSAYFSKHIILINRNAYTAQISLTLNTGPRYYFGPITFKQSILSNRLLERYIPFKVGDPYSSVQLLKLQENLNKSGYFQNVSILDSPINSFNQHQPISLILTPRPSQQYTAGIGYGTDVGVRGTLGWESRYLNKAGHRLSIFSQLSKIQNGFQTTYTFPGKHPNTDNYTINFAIVRKKLAQVTRTTQQIGTTSTCEWNGWQRNLFLNYQVERFNYLNQPTKNARLLTPGINLSYSKSDNPLFSLQGYRFNFRLQGAAQPVLSTVSFLQTELQGKYIFSWNDNNRLLFRGDIGYTLTSNLSNFPPSLLFYAGGSQNIRGYAYQSLGPGRYLLVGSIEYQHRLIRNFYGALFFDAGNAVNDFPIHLQKGAGIGLVWASPLGPLELTAGKALDIPSHPIRFQFTMGFDFL
ncbi:autotransporter assembly complex protein TamA [Rickettsiella grylli]|uniref:Outer membrane protein n=1 Tax=Rickettsiella grylli TaxID=59196 RepID=A8PKX2_9COXI|nr:outer membrane protein assembly factor [Rickettsiella grylli]EDP45736.1 outer membrane protein [Rickettsiella grylli]